MILHPKQQEIIRSKARFKIVRAGRKGGKTTLTTEDMGFHAVQKKDRNIFYIAPTQTQARDIVWEQAKRRFYGVGEFNQQRLEIKLPTRDGGHSIIKLSGWENRENFRGKTAHKLVFDEVDTMKDFFIGWQDIFRPTLLDTSGGATFIGTPKKENPNLRRLEKLAQTDPSYAAFHFTSFDNPYLSQAELESIKREYQGNYESYQQEILAEYIDNAGALFKYDSLIDIFSNTVVKDNQKYMTVDIADDGTDKTIFSLWDSLEEYRREEFERMNTENIIAKIREYALSDQIPFSHIAVDAIGVGAGVASSSLLDGIIGFKSSYTSIKTDLDIVRLPNVGYTEDVKLTSDYKNLRSQCLFVLADHVNNHKIASRVTGKQKEAIIEELSNYQDASSGDGKRMATPKEKVMEIIGHSPDASDCFIMRMYFVIMGKIIPQQSEFGSRVVHQQQTQFKLKKSRQTINSTK